MFKPKYRIVPGYLARYWVQIRYWWWPFYFTHYRTDSIIDAKQVIQNCKENN